MSAHWECSEETSECLFKRDGQDILVVLSRKPFNNQKVFTWVELYNSKHSIKDNESLFWSLLYKDDFIVLCPYEYKMGQVTTLFKQEETNSRIIELFERTKKGKTETFNMHVNKLSRILSEIRDE